MLSVNRLNQITTIAVIFLILGTFTSVTVQGAYQVLFLLPLILLTRKAFGKDFRLPTSAWLMLGFAFVAVLSVLVNWDVIPKPLTNFGKAKYYIYAALGIFPLRAWLSGSSDLTKSRLVKLLAVVMLICGLWCAYQVLIQGKVRAVPFTDIMRHSYGAALLIILWLSLALHRGSTRNWLPQRWSWVGIFGLLLTLVFVQARGSQGAFILGLPFVVFFWNKKIGMIVALISGLVLGGIAWNYFYGSQTQSSIKILNASGNASDSIRRTQWMSGLIAFKEKPILGWGHGNLHSQVKRIKVENNLGAQDYVGHAHNVLIEVAAGTGILGLFFFVGAFLTWMWECWKRGGATRAIMMPFFVAIMFEAQFEVILDANNATWIGFLYAVTVAVQKRYQSAFS